MSLRPILLVEDNNDDAFFMQRAFQAIGIQNVSLAGDGEAAISYFSNPETSDASKRPSLVLLDLKLPLKTGFDVLQWIRENKELRTLAVIVLTSSSEPSDISRALQLGANAYVVKPAAYGDVTKLAASIRDFWLRFHRAAA